MPNRPNAPVREVADLVSSDQRTRRPMHSVEDAIPIILPVLAQGETTAMGIVGQTHLRESETKRALAALVAAGRVEERQGTGRRKFYRLSRKGRAEIKRAQAHAPMVGDEMMDLERFEPTA